MLLDALVNLLRLRDYSRVDEYDAAVLELLRLQCRSVELPSGLNVRKKDLARLLPLERLADASKAFCGAFLLKNGSWVIARGLH